MLVCQDGSLDNSDTWQHVNPGERVPLHLRSLPIGDSHTASKSRGGHPLDLDENTDDSPHFAVRFQPLSNSKNKNTKWEWSGPVFPSSLGSFSLKVRATDGEGGGESGGQNSQRSDTGNFGEQKDTKGKSQQLLGLSTQTMRGLSGTRALRFFLADVSEEDPSLVMRLRLLSTQSVPYRIENGLRTSSISFCQKGMDNWELLEPGCSVGYVWDDLSLPRKLVVSVTGSQVRQEVNLDKVRPWKSLRKKNPLLRFDLPFGQDNMEENENNGGGEGSKPVGLEVYADGLTRVAHICPLGKQYGDWRSVMGAREPLLETDIRVSLIGLTVLENAKQESEGISVKQPILYMQITSTTFELDLTKDSLSSELKTRSIAIDTKWQGAPFVVLLRPYRETDNSADSLHAAIVINRHSLDPRHLRYASILLQAMELNLDEETLMKLVPFSRSRSFPYTYPPSSPIYFERFEIHPIKIVASFQPGAFQSDYSSAQETLRALLHSVIQVPAVRGTTVELNGVLLTHALLSYTQLALKCAQHYSWYAMRAVYVARGSQLLPPGFSSLFDDSSSSSIDVFFDPSNGSIDVAGLTLGMFGLLRKGLQRRGKRGGTSRYIGEIKNSVRVAGSNLLYAVATEVSDNMLKGVETAGVDGLFNGLRRGILKVAMQPSMLRSAVVKGGATRRFHLDRSIGTDEVYVEGYLQAMLDALFKQDYLRVKVSNDEVVLKNLPPNSALSSEIVSTVKQFLVSEGLLAGQSSAAGIRSLRRLRGETERQVGPAVRALLEQLAVLIIVKAMRQRVGKFLRIEPSNREDSSTTPTKNDKEREEERNESRKMNPPLRKGVRNIIGHVLLSSVVAFLDGRLCRHIPNPLVRRIVSGFLLSFVEM